MKVSELQQFTGTGGTGGTQVGYLTQIQYGRCR